MFKGLFGRRKRELNLAAGLLKKAAHGAQLSTLRVAAQSIGVTIEDVTPEAVATTASELTRRLARACAADISSNQTAYVAGLFAVAGANFFSFQCGVPFEESATLSLLKLRNKPPEAFAAFHADVIAVFNEMTRAKNDTIRAIGGMIAAWEQSPTLENQHKLERLFQICLDATATSDKP